MSLGLLPSPRSLAIQPGRVVWESPLRIVVPEDWQWVVERFAQDLMSAVDWRVEIVGQNETPDIEIAVDDAFADEGFELRVDDCTRISARTAAGVSYALATLRQLAPLEVWGTVPRQAVSLELPRVEIKDGPAFAWRGVHLDVARHFWSVADVCRFIDLIAVHRLNKLHLHLNDDQGWRVAIPSWPRLTQVGSRRRSSPLGHEDDGVDDDRVHEGFYSADDLEDIRQHADSRCVQVIPEIDLPGHAQAAIAAYPQLGNTDKQLEVWTRWGISEHVLNPGREALAFAGDVVEYVAGLFPGSPVHIGGDECLVDEWRQSPVAQEVMSENGFVDERSLQGLFTNRMSAVLRPEGHEAVAWDEVLDADVPEGTLIMAWRRPSKGVEAAERGFDVVMAPMNFTYFDWRNSDAASEPVSVAPVPFVTPWEKVYRFSVYPPGLREGLRHHVRGAQAQLWTEYISTRDHLDYMAFPRLCAFSEVVWGTHGALKDFRERLEIHLGRLGSLGVSYRPLDPS